MLNQDAKVRLETLASVIEELEFLPAIEEAEDGAFTMEQVAYDCGTPACIAGWSLAIFGGYVDGIPTLEEYLDSDEEGEVIDPIFDRISELYNLPDTKVLALCCPDNGAADYFAAPYDDAFISPERAARQIRHLIATGEVDWAATPRLD